MRTKFLSFALAILMSMAASVASAFEVDGIYYIITSSSSPYTVEVICRGDGPISYYTGSVTIPESVTYNGITYSVTSIGERAFEYCDGLTSVTIGNSVTSIGESAFCGCDNLTSVTIGSSVTSIGFSAFDYCWSLPSITIPNSVTNIGSCAFIECRSLTSITIPNSVTCIGSSAFEGTAWYDNQPDGLVYAGKVAYTYKGTMPEETNIVLEEGTVGIADGAFYECNNLTSITIPNSVTRIGDNAFDGCYGLTSVTIGNSVTSIGSFAFIECRSLTSVTIPNSVTNIGDGAFYDCSGLTSIIIPNSVTSIGGDSFRGCTGLTSITIPNSVTRIDGSTFQGCTGLTTITIPNSVTSIGGWAFQGCIGLTSVTIPNSVTNIGDYAFYGCSGMTSITIPNSVTNIDEWAFYGTAWYNNQPDGVVYAGRIAYAYKGTMPEGTNIVLEEGTLRITSYAFNECTGLTSVTIPNTVTSIGERTFYGCKKLTRINCRATTPPICGPYSMYSVPEICTIEVPIGCKAAYEAVSPWNNFTIVETEDPVETTTVTLAAEYGTFCSTKALDFTNVEGLKAYIASAFDAETGQLILTRVYNVKAGTGLILRGTKGETYEIPVGTGATTVSNLLVGVTEDTELEPIDGEFTNFILAKDAVKGIGFYRVASRSTLKAGKAYLQLPSDELSSEVKGFRMLFDDGDMSDGVETMHNSQCIMHNGAGAVYDLQGRRVAKPTKGIYIVNGKKTVIK